jgi:hypothetical protein
VERSLSIETLSEALSGRTNLPTAQELQAALADAEAQLFMGSIQATPEILDAAWYLHGIASLRHARQLYSLHRQRQAFLVSAHIFDLALNDAELEPIERLSLGFASAIGYRLGGRDPNATAIMRRVFAEVVPQEGLQGGRPTLALEAGLVFLGFETRTAFKWFRDQRLALRELAEMSGTPSLSSTWFGPAELVVLGAEDVLAYLARGDVRRLDRGLERLRTAALGLLPHRSVDARWVAAHLLRFAEEAAEGSLWNPDLMPPTVSPLVRQAFTFGKPAVLTLWQPQRELLMGTTSPFDPAVTRMVMAVPTSGGKTLVAQMLAVEHLARTNTGVCYVVPTRTLGREVRSAMADRTRVVQKEVAPEAPDFASFALDLDLGEQADVEVMTPERLAYLLRHDHTTVLDRFGLFVFDEAQLIKESGRGFVLESVIAALSELTEGTGHRLVLISAAMGNSGQIAQWLDPTGAALLHRSDWRGPRRLHAAFTTDARWGATTVTQVPRARRWSYRLTTELTGLLRLRMASGYTAQLAVTDVDWKLVRKATSPSPNQAGLPRDDASTRQYQIAADMVQELVHAGSVLIVASTRAQAKEVAVGLAGIRPVDPRLAPLATFVREQLGQDHPLVPALERGVGFHHAGLPVEVLEALEAAVREDVLPVLACTSTLTDGVNLPVRTVVIYDQTYEGQDPAARLRGARLVNAMGRAGRAGRETEGWIVLVRAAEPSERDFRDLEPDANDLAVTSSLIGDLELQELAQVEDRIRQDADVLFEASGPQGFIAFVWWMLALKERDGVLPEWVNIESLVDRTLAAAQSDDARLAYGRLAGLVRRAYVNTDPLERTRWARTGTSLGSARQIDRMADRVARSVRRAEAAGVLGDVSDPFFLVPALARVLRELLELPEAPRWRFRSSVRGRDITVEPQDFLMDWLRGESYVALGIAHLRQVADPSYRIEQVVDAVTSHFEHYLAWTVGALLELVNARLSETNSEIVLCPELGSYIRYGVSTPTALVLMTSGIRSRRLANRIAEALPVDVTSTREGVREWLASLSIGDWRSNLGATASEVLDLLNFTRRPRRSLLRTLLEAGAVEVTLEPTALRRTSAGHGLSLEPARGEPSPAALVVYAGSEAVSATLPEDHADLQAILDTGLDLQMSLTGGPDPRLEVRLEGGA